MPTDNEVAERDLLPTHLPIGFAMTLSLFLVVVFGVALAGAVFVSVPDTIRGPFVLAPEGGADPVRAPREGALAEILVAETGEVRRGQDLFVIRSSELRNWTSELRTLEQEFDSVGRRLSLLEQEQKVAVEIQATRIQQFDKDLGFQQEYLTTLRDLLQRYEQLDTEGLVPRVDVMSQRLAASKGERDVAVTRQSRDMAVLEAARLRTEFRSRAGDLEVERRKTSVRMTTLRSLLEGASEDVVRVSAPFDGTVVSLQKKNPGDVVSFGQELCRIARSDSALIAEISPSEEGMGRLRVGQRVQLFYDAYPYERFGTGRGTLRWVSPAAVVSATGDRFLVRAALEAQALDGSRGARPLRAGMRGQARVHAGRRTVIGYVFEPLRKLRETMGAR